MKNTLIVFLSLTTIVFSCTQNEEVPNHLKEYKDLYQQNPKEASSQWFRDAKYGLFIHYGLYSINGEHPFVQYRNKIPVKVYEQRMHEFTAEKFNAQEFVDLAKKAGMKYITFVTKHCDGFSLWNSKSNPFNSVNSAANRDFVAEMVEACNDAGIGIFLFYEHGFDWRHPHAPRSKDWSNRLTEVPYDNPDPTYATTDYDLNNYVDYVAAQIRELLTQYGPVAGIWLDGIGVPISGDYTKFKLPELYDMIREIQPHALISYKFGVTGTEDFLAPEYIQLGRIDIEDKNRKPTEICFPLNKSWGYIVDEPQAGIDELMEWKEKADQINANLLINVGPVGDGSILKENVETLIEFGKRTKK
jgi:alpha-L-fucosidase